MPSPEATHVIIHSAHKGRATIIARLPREQALKAAHALSDDPFWLKTKPPKGHVESEEDYHLWTTAFYSGDDTIFVTPLRHADALLAKLKRGHEYV